MAEYNVVQSDDGDGYWRIDGLKIPLTNITMTFQCAFDPADTDEKKVDKLIVELHEIRVQHPSLVKDGDTFNTPFTKMVVRGSLVVADDPSGTQAQAAAVQQHVATTNYTLGQACAANGITLPPQLQHMANTPIGQIPYGTISVPPHMKNLFAPPTPPPQAVPTQGVSPQKYAPIQSAPHAQAQHVPAQPSIGPNMGLSPLGTLNPVPNPRQFIAFHNGQHVGGTLMLNDNCTNQDVVDEFEASGQMTLPVSGSLRCAISIVGAQRRVLEVTYGSDVVVLEVAV